MATINSRSSVLAIKKETTEGTPVVPSAGTSAIALQPGFQMKASIEMQKNDEIRASLGEGKPIPGAENPSCNPKHYLRHSGVEGTEPNYGPILESFFGSKDVAGTEYDTASGSTTISFAMPTGEGSHFQRGQGLLLKDTANGYRIRAVHSVSTDNLIPSFKVPTAPGTGVNTGKSVTYLPANSGHPTLTFWHYLGNGGAVQMMCGARITSMQFDVTAGQLINGQYEAQGLQFFFDPIQITSSTCYIDWTDDDGTFAAAVAVQWYQSPKALADAIAAAMGAANTNKTFTVTYNGAGDGKFKILTTGTVLTLKWNTGSNTANSIASKIGFSTAADSSGTAATTGYTSTTALNLAFAYTASYDSADPLAAKYHEVMIGDQTDYVCFAASTVSISGKLDRATIDSICAESGRSGSTITGRTVEVTVKAQLSQYDADKFQRYMTAADTRFQYSFGTRVGGNWVAGKCGYFYVPSAVIQDPEVSDENGAVIISFKVKAYVDSSGNGEFYMGFL